MLALFFVTACGSLPSKTSIDNSGEFRKICLEGSGKGRIELLTNKYTFSYESQINRPKNKFDLVLDFPVVGERQLELSLDPATVNQTIKNSELTELLNNELGERADKKRIAKAIEEFFVFSSDFMRFRASNVFPKHYSATSKDGHFILERSTASYRFVVDNSVDNQKFFERLILKIYIKGLSNDAILTLFLVPQSCDKQ